MKKIIFPVLVLLFGCKNDDLAFLNTVEQGLTVEAYVEAGKSPIIYLTTGLPVNGFNEIDFLSAIESTAKVEVFENEKSEIATFSKDNSKFPSRFYGFDEIKGKVGQLYKIKITIGEKEYISESIVPEKPVLSDISVVEQSTFKDGVYNLKIDLINPKIDSYYKFYIRNTNSEEFEKASIFVVSNEFINTPILTIFNDFIDFDEDGKKLSLLENNTTYDLKIVAITKQEFEFWDEILDSQTDLFNFPSLVQEVPSNISNDAFGFFGGNNELITTVIINK